MPLVGAAIGECLDHRDALRAGSIGMQTWIGMLLGIVAKLAIVFTMFGVFVVGIAVLERNSAAMRVPATRDRRSPLEYVRRVIRQARAFAALQGHVARVRPALEPVDDEGQAR